MKRILFCLSLLLTSLQISAQTVIINETSGWLESAFVKWTPVAGATSYNVYYTGGGQTNKKIDTQLIRSYGTYFRADIPGLAAGTYTVKVTPVTTSGEGTGNTSNSVTVLAQDRTGFSFDGGRIPGGYKADGTPKTGAVILYITQNTKNTISYNIVTSANGTTTNYVGLQNLLYGIKKGYDTRPFIIRLIGNITDMTVMEGGDITIENNQNANSYLTIEGIGNDAVVNGMGIRLKSASNIEVSNLGFMNCDSTAGDNVGMQQDNDHIWVHNCDLFYGNAGSDADQIKGDGALDNKGSTYVTLSYNHFWDNGKSSLLGLSENTTVGLYITYHHNWFDHSDSRHPRVRFYSAHVYNNYYDGNSKYGVGSTMGSSVFVEGNYFRNSKHPMLTSLQGTDIWDETNQVNNAGTMGTFSGETGGSIKAFNNTFVADNGTNNMRFVAYGDPNTTYNISGKINSLTDFDAYLATTRGENVPSTVTSKSGGNTYNNFDTDPALYVKNVVIDTPTAARDKAINYSGRVSGGDLKITYNNAVDDSAYLVNTVEKNAVTNYASTMVFVQGESTTTLASQTLTSTTNNNQTVTSATAIGTIVFTWGGDATDVTVTGLPASGINFVKNATAKTITISGTPTATLSYSITTSGTLGTTGTGSGTITVAPASVQTLTSTTNNDQTVASGIAIDPIVYTWGGDATDATVTGLPASGISFVKNATSKTITISGTPTATLSYSIATSGVLGTTVSDSGTITVPTATIGDDIHNFTVSGKTSPFYTFGTTANLSTSYGTASFAGLTLTQCLKIESATTITFTTTQASTLTLVMNSTKTDPTAQIKVDGTIYTNASGIITLPLAAGTHVLTRNNPANLFYIKTAYDTVTPVTTAQTIIFNTLTPVTYGAATFGLAATASSSLAVTYTSSNTAVATVSGNILTIVGAGSTNITASQVGNVSYTAATDVMQPLTVNAKTLTILSPLAQSKPYDGNVAASIAGTLSGVINADDVTLVLSGTFSDATPGTGKLVTSTATLIGTKAVNYALTQPSGLTAAITIPAPTANAQTFCGTATVANLVATGTTLKWYAAASGGNILNSSTNLSSGTYYVSQTLAGVEGTARTSVAVTIQAAPFAGTSGSLTICAGTAITNTDLFAVIGTHDQGGTWSNSGSVYTYTVYPTSPCTTAATATVTVTVQANANAGTDGTLNVATGVSPTDSQLFAALTGADLGGSWTHNGLIYTYTVAATSPCTISDTAIVTVSEVIPSTFSVCSGTTVAMIVGTSSLKFYTAASGGTFLAGTTALGNKTYFVTQVVGGVESIPRKSVVITVNALPTAPSALVLTNDNAISPTTAVTALGVYIGTNTPFKLTATAANASSYVWTLPTGVDRTDVTGSTTFSSTTSTDEFIYVKFGAYSSTKPTPLVINVQSVNASGCISAVKASATLTRLLPITPATLVMTDASLPVSATTGLPTSVTSIAKYMGTNKELTLTAAAVPTATSYDWELPTGVIQLSGGTSNVITVNFSGVTSSNTDNYSTTAAVPVSTNVLRIGVKSRNGVGVSTTANTTLVNPISTSTAKLLTLTAVAPASPATLVLTNAASATPTTPVTNVSKFIGTTTEFTLTAAASALASSYSWEIPSGVSVVQGSNLTSNTIKVNFANVQTGTTALVFGVKAVNGMGSSVSVNIGANSSRTDKLLTLAATVPVAPTTLVLTNAASATPATAVTVISKYIGTTTELTLTAAVSPLANSYSWNIPSGVNVVQGSDLTSNSIKVNLANVQAGTTALVFGVKAVNGMGSSVSVNIGATSSRTDKLLTVTAVLPAVVAVVNGATSVCDRPEGFSYTINTAPLGANSYVITAPVGSVVSSTNGVAGATPNVLTTSDLTFKVVFNGTTPFPLTDKNIVIRSVNGVGQSLTAKSILLTKLASCSSLTTTTRLAVATVNEEFDVIAYPNPSSDVFRLEVQSSGKEKSTIEVQVYDMTGRLIEQRQVDYNSFELGSNYLSGVYNVIVNQGENTKTLRVIKK